MAEALHRSVRSVASFELCTRRLERNQHLSLPFLHTVSRDLQTLRETSSVRPLAPVVQKQSKKQKQICAASISSNEFEEAPTSASANGRAAANSLDAGHLLKAVSLASSSAGLTAPHPNAGCVLAHGAQVVGEGFLYAQGTESAEIQAVRSAGLRARGATAYLNLEPVVCHGDDKSVRALIEAGIQRAVIGLRHPLLHLKGNGIDALQKAAIKVEVLGEEGNGSLSDVEKECWKVNEALIYRAEYKRPFSVLKYAMTLDGKIAASTGHAAWVSAKESRQKVFAMRGRSDAIIVGGNTVRRDNPRLTTRTEGGHLPIRIVMSRTLRLPDDANLWDVSAAPTIVMTQKGAREDFQDRLRSKGVEIVEFDFLTPDGVMEYCYQRGFLQVLWECGGMLSAPAIQAGVIHRVMAFVAPKIIGGITAPSPVGELGFVEMTQAMSLTDVKFQPVGPDLMISGYLQTPSTNPIRPFTWAAPNQETAPTSSLPAPSPRIVFYKAWDQYGALSNFSSHPITMPGSDGQDSLWPSVEHYYQAQKFAGVSDATALGAVRGIREAKSPEEAARIGRALERLRPDLLQPNWNERKVETMYHAVRRKFEMYPDLRKLLVSMGDFEIVENAPHDFFWGIGRTGQGQNNLGKVLTRIRSQLQEALGERQGMTTLQGAS